MIKFIVLLAATAMGASVAAAQGALEGTNYSQSAETIKALIRDHHYDPSELEKESYQAIEAAFIELGQNATTDDKFIDGFNALWRDGPFSHVNLSKAQGTADELADYLDNLRIGGGGATLAWEGRTAILTVNTMMGLDTIEEIDAAYQEIASRGADNLIIDLRENGGGAFAVRPLVGHLIGAPYDAGVFVSRRWNAENEQPPSRDTITEIKPWEGWSIRAFWKDAQSDLFVRVQFAPAQPQFVGPVAVLTSARTASAAELAADALRGSGRATLIGEPTAGEMLSQKPYDVPGGFHLFLPIADYFSSASGRIEGAGIEPDIAVDAGNAMASARQTLAKK